MSINKLTLEELKVSIANLQSQYNQLKANIDAIQMEDKMKQHMNNMYEYMYQITDSLRQYIYKVSDSLMEHKSNGHLPQIVGAGKMNNILQKLDLDDDFEVQKKLIYASKNHYIIEAECKPSKI